MPKVTGPLFSLEAFKSINKILTFQRRPGGPAAYAYKVPKVPLTVSQRLQRWDIASAVRYWQCLSAEAKAEWEEEARWKGQSGYSLLVSRYCQENYDRPLWLPMQEGSGGVVIDRSGHDNDGDINGATWGQLTSGVQYLSFDGIDDFVQVADSDSLDITGDITIEAWVYLNGWGEGGNFGRIVEKEGAYWLYVTNTGNLIFGLGGVTGTPFSSLGSPLSLDGWHRVLITRGRVSGDVTFRVNGAFVRTVVGGGEAITISNNDLYIGNRAAKDRTFQGNITITEIENRVVSGIEDERVFDHQKGLFGV